MSSECIFCKIIAGELPASKVYEDDETLAFLDIAPVVKGHTLVIPRLHAPQITDTPEAVLAATIRTVRKVARAQQIAFGAEGLNITQANGDIAGQVVPHLHFHVIPRFARDGKVKHWTQHAYEDPEEMQRYAQRLRDAASGERA